MATVTLKVEKRSKTGSLESRRVRRSGAIPCVVYGQGKNPEHGSVPLLEFEKAMRLHTRVFELGMGGKPIHAFLKEVQYDHLGDRVLHVDFLRVTEGQKVQVKVALEFEGHPKGVTAGGAFVHEVADLDVDCDVDKIPENIPVDVKDLEIDQAITVADLKLPTGVSCSLDPETVICRVTTKSAEPEPGAEAAAEPGEGEPEVITKRPESEEGGEGGDKPKEGEKK